ncbi:hypothetical protein B0T13DRAFT_325886 [Neurospora crassa]|nr:hypothetical protein B0T13DRAFT_325886 [Neurospora crassa]
MTTFLALVQHLVFFIKFWFFFGSLGAQVQNTAWQVLKTGQKGKMPLNKGVDKSMVCILEKDRKKVSSPGIDIHHVVTNSQRLYLLDNTDISSNISRGRMGYGTEIPASSHAAVTTIGFPSFRVFFSIC